MPVKTRLAACCLLAASLAFGAAPADAAVILPPIEGTSAIAGDVLRTGDGLQIVPRRDGDTLLVRGDDGFALHERRSGGRLVALGAHLNHVDRVSIELNAEGPMLWLNGVEWNPRDDTTYNLPNGGAIAFGTPRFPIVLTSAAGDRAVLTAADGRLALTLQAADGLLDGSREGLLAFDAGTAAGDDAVDRDGAPADVAAARRSWSLVAGETLITRSAGGSCAVALGDGIGKRWGLDVAGDARAGEAGNLAGGALLRLSDRAPITAGPAACSTEMDGREVVAPVRSEAQTLPAGVTAVRKTLVGAAGAPFVRHLVVLRNTRATPVALTLVQRFDRADGAPVGVVTATSSGDALGSPADSWLAAAPVRASRFDAGYFATAVAWHDPLTRADGADAVLDLDDVPAPQDPSTTTPPPAPFGGGDRALGVVFGDVRLAPHEQATYLTAQLADDVIPGAEERIAALAATPEELFAGLSEDERRSLRNWRPVGDADGDGRDDLDDACPARAASTADGCPAPATERPPAPPAPEVRTEVVGVPVPAAATPRAVPRAVTARARRSAARRVTVSGSVGRPAGMTAACGGFVELVVRRSGRGAAVRRYVPVRATCRFTVSADLPSAWRHRGVTVRVRFLGSDRLLPRSARTLTVAAPARRARR